jgi:lysophospholipase L1-like esterase
MRRFILPLAALVLGLALGVGVMKLRWPHLEYSHLDGRSAAIASHAALAGPIETVVVGDSLVERAVIPALCGGSVLNAGIGGARVHEIDLTMTEPARPKRIVIAVGVNDAQTADRFDLNLFASSYAHLVDQAKARAASVSVGLVGPIASTGPLGSGHYSRDRIGQMNGAIRKVAAARGVRVIDFPAALGSNGDLPAAYTRDGVHLTPEGYKPWLAALAQACDT